MSTVSLAMTLLHAAERRADLLKQLDLNEFEKKVQVLLQPIDVPAPDLEYSRQRGLVLRSAIPTLADVDALCDLRAVFRHLPSGSKSESHTSKVGALLGFEPVAIVALELNDASGNDKPFVFQVSEQGLRNLIKTLQETLAQLEIVRNMKPAIAAPIGSR